MNFSKTIVRLQKATIQNVKNVSYGSVDFPSSLNPASLNSRSDIVGIYGQNGSGKTAMISALGFLKTVLSGLNLSPKTFNFIKMGSEAMRLSFGFILFDDTEKFSVDYSFSIIDEKKPSADGLSFSHVSHVCKESLRIKKEGDTANHATTVIDTDLSKEEEKDYAFTPKTSFELTIKEKDKSLANDLIYARRFAYDNSSSFIFSEKAISSFKESSLDSSYFQIIQFLQFYGRMDLFVADTEECTNLLIPIHFRLSHAGDKATLVSGSFPLPLAQTDLPTPLFEDLKTWKNSINSLLGTLVPGVSIDLKNVSSITSPTGQPGNRFQIVSVRDGVVIPFSYESGGIRKIVSVLSCLISAYNSESVLVAIDEFDSGIFEYLLGEVIEVFSESAKGQLIFTSHNLRPLEILGNNGIYLTTTDPNNRYARYSFVREESNFRNKYLRAVKLDSAVTNDSNRNLYYSPTFDGEIRHAFRSSAHEK